MRITRVRTMRLEGLDPGGIGGKARTYSFLLVCIDTDAGLHGIGEALDFPGVRPVIEASGSWLVGRDPLRIGPVVRGLLYGALPAPGDAPAPSIMSATATVAGPPAWAAAQGWSPPEPMAISASPRSIAVSAGGYWVIAPTRPATASTAWPAQ